MSARPTLVRRLVLSLLLAFALIFAFNLAVIFWQVTDQDRADARLRGRAENLLASIDAAAGAEQARTIAAAVAGALNQSAGPPPAIAPANPRAQRQGGVQLVLADASGAALYRSAGPAWTPPATPGRPADVAAEGRTMRAYRAASRRWSVTVAEEKFNPGWLLLKISRDMGIYLLVSFLLVLGAIWIAVSRGLRPLKLLSGRIAARGPDDLRPLGVSPIYAELTPLTAAIDDVLEKLRSKLETERRFVQDAAHELRTPLAVISAQAHVLARTCDGVQRAGAERDMDRAIGRASRLIDQLLALAQADSAPHGKPAVVDVAELVRQELAMLAPAAMARCVELSLESPDELPSTLETHGFQTILQNLLSNAIEYGRHGGQVRVELSERAGILTLSVADDGPGIPVAEQAGMFERFRRGAGQQAPGSGLGLAIVRQAAARLGGTVSLAPGLAGTGCTFALALPGTPR